MVEYSVLIYETFKLQIININHYNKVYLCYIKQIQTYSLSYYVISIMCVEVEVKFNQLNKVKNQKFILLKI